MGSLWRLYLFLLITLSVAGCADSETRSIVSKADLPQHGYRKIVIFVEGPQISPSPPPPKIAGAIVQFSISIPLGPPPPNAPEFEQKVISGLQNAGVTAMSGSGLFAGKNLSEQAKKELVQNNFDAVLYVVLEVGKTEEGVAATHNGQVVTFATGVVTPINELSDNYVFKPDGSVYFLKTVIKTKCDLQDTKSAKEVWSAETIATGGLLVMAAAAANQIIEKMRNDGVI